MGKLRLFAPADVVARADEVMRQIIEICDLLQHYARRGMAA